MIWSTQYDLSNECSIACQTTSLFRNWDETGLVKIDASSQISNKGCSNICAVSTFVGRKKIGMMLIWTSDEWLFDHWRGPTSSMEISLGTFRFNWWVFHPAPFNCWMKSSNLSSITKRLCESQSERLSKLSRFSCSQ